MDNPPVDFPSTNPRASPGPRGRLWPRVALVGLALLGSYGVLAYVILPQVWVSYARWHPALDETPNITLTSDQHPGDPLNVALVGSQDDVQQSMRAAKWYPADPLGLRSDLKIAAATVLKRKYDEAPVSKLYLFGRPEDLAFEQPVGNDPRQRHHVRFWKCDRLDDQGRPLWVGSATYDKRVGLSRTTGQITHHIAADVDAERDHLIDDLKRSGNLDNVQAMDGFHQVLRGKNGGGDPWFTDGRLLIGTLRPSIPQ